MLCVLGAGLGAARAQPDASVPEAASTPPPPSGAEPAPTPPPPSVSPPADGGAPDALPESPASPPDPSVNVKRVKGPPQQPMKAPPDEEWYGGQTLLVDGSALVLTVGGQGSQVTVLGLTTAFLGTPIVHVVHGEFLSGLGSLALRGGLPIAGGLALASRESCGGEHDMSCGLGGFVGGALLGYIGAACIDAFVLAYESKDTAPPPSTWLVPISDGEQTGLAVGGRF